MTSQAFLKIQLKIEMWDKQHPLVQGNIQFITLYTSGPKLH